MSQIFYLGLSFYFIKSRKLSLKNYQKLPVFLNKIKTKPYIKNLRHGMNVFVEDFIYVTNILKEISMLKE